MAFRPPESASEFENGVVVPGTSYRIEALIGRGGMGTVYEVEDLELGKRYVLKTLHAKYTGRADLVERMRREARALAKLNHRNIVQVIAAGETQEEQPRRYCVMEKLNGLTLRALMDREGKLEFDHARVIAEDILEALEVAHQSQLVHRDVKPENIFLHIDPEGGTVPKLLDFGIVALLDIATSETAGKFIGTPRYASPEQLRGIGVSPQSDLYSLALVLFEMLTGSGPFDALEDEKMFHAHLHEVPPRLRSFFPSLATEVDDVVARALEKDPFARPSSARAFAGELYRLSSHRERTDGITQASLSVSVQRAVTPATPDNPEALLSTADGEDDPADPPKTRDPNAFEATAIDRAVATRTSVPPMKEPQGSDTVAAEAPAPPPIRPSLVPSSTKGDARSTLLRRTLALMIGLIFATLLVWGWARTTLVENDTPPRRVMANVVPETVPSVVIAPLPTSALPVGSVIPVSESVASSTASTTRPKEPPHAAKEATRAPATTLQAAPFKTARPKAGAKLPSSGI